MKVVNVSIRPTEAALQARRPALTPELLAATGARYSRNNEGLDSILQKIDPENIDRSVDSIFKMIDYGHQSIADMAPVAMFIDDVSIFLAYLVWSWSPTAGGQESSTRYIRLDPGGLVAPELLGVPEDQRTRWQDFMARCFIAYAAGLEFWERVGEAQPQLLRLPEALLSDRTDKAQRQVARMRRNFAFDRARYFLPVAARTNLMLVMSARGWAQLCQNLLSHPLPEAQLLGTAIRSELELSAPRLVRHAERKTSFVAGHEAEQRDLVKVALRHGADAPIGATRCTSEVEVLVPPDVLDSDLTNALLDHDNRYAYVGAPVRRTAIRFSWTAVAMAEIRDLNRHRTGSKHCPLVPRGFYCAEDQLPSVAVASPRPDRAIGDEATSITLAALQEGRLDYAAWTLLGTQYSFEHVTTMDKYVYEAELRTGAGAHYRYATHLRDSLNALRATLPMLASHIRTGLAEPE